MKKLLMTMLMVMLLIGGCTPYTRNQKIALGVYVATAFADIRTTQLCMDDGYRETNPFLNDHPSDFELISLKVVVLGVLYGLGEVVPEKREALYYGCSAMNLGGAIWNYDVRN